MRCPMRLPYWKNGRILIGDGLSRRWLRIAVDLIQSGLWLACLLAYRAASTNAGSRGFQRTTGLTAGALAGTPSSTLAVSSAITTLPDVSTAASGSVDPTRAWLYAATSWAPPSRARMRNLLWVWAAAFASHPRAASGRSLRQHEMFRTAIGSLLTTSRTATATQVQS